ncbi:dehydrogenase/reductase SDR family member 2, mitochondrial [Monodelphis domestica]|uniref:dehydrogenase/reductase SDR family member 2, mitochondrial n=1 Tax=Monodelphis domestica TaxID=13616 RepID=UPI0024E1B548|nr:dehydrogenase/reductase SDR family member 2, mitochondrial [Monodelphis domestica]
MFRKLAFAYGTLFSPRSLLPVRMSSTDVNKKGILADKVAVIIGSTQGIGFAIAQRLARDGAYVVVSSRKQENVDQAVALLKEEGLSSKGMVCHAGKAEDRDKLVKMVANQYGGVDFLICVAGVNPLVGSTLGASEQVWDKILDVNVKSPALLLAKLLPYMEKRGSSSVVLVSSVTGYVPVPKLGPYNISKTALLGLTKTLAMELAPKGIRVNCLVPGLIKTDFSHIVQDEDIINALETLYAMQRTGQPEDCAGIVSFLCSPDASYITGENIVVAGFSPKM